MGFPVMRLRKTFALVVCMAFGLLAVGFAAPPAAAAGSPTIHLWMSRAGGWGITNTSLQNPGPNLAVTLGDNVTLYLNGTDNRNHNWFIDYNNNSAVNANETNVSSPNFRNPTELKEFHGLPGRHIRLPVAVGHERVGQHHDLRELGIEPVAAGR